MNNYSLEQKYNYIRIMQYLIKRRYPDFVFASSVHWTKELSCLLCDEYIGVSHEEDRMNHIINHLKENNLLCLI